MTLDEAVSIAVEALEDVRACFKPGVKITLLVRTPDIPERDFCLSEDTKEEVLAMVERRWSEPAT